MKALEDTVGMTRPRQAAFWLEKIAAAIHRGPKRDTWTSARDRAAEFAGIETSMAKRIWQRWAEMKGVDGDALIKLMVAYEAIYQTEAAGDGYEGSVGRSERLAKVIASASEAQDRKVGERRRTGDRRMGLTGMA